MIQNRCSVMMCFLLLLVSCGGDPSGVELDGKVTAAFNSLEGSYVSSQTMASGSFLAEPENPVRPGYTFGGWHKESGCINSWNFSSDKIERDLTLYAGWTAVASSGLSEFYLINSFTVSSGLNIIYNKEFSGNISYKVSRTSYTIIDQTGFNSISSVDVSGTKNITADNLIYDDYIYTGSIMGGTKFYVYLLNNTTGDVKTLSRATETNSGYTKKTGTIDGSAAGGSVISYTVYYPHGYDASSSKTWPFILSVKAPAFVDGNNNFPCIVFKTDVSGSAGVLQIDTDNVKKKIRSIIENPSYRIDQNRLYTVGFSAGGCAALIIANDDGSDKYMFKAVEGVGVSSWLGNSAYCKNLGDVGIWLLYGENDNTYGPQTVTAYNGITTNTPGRSCDLNLTKMTGTGHDSSPVWASPYTYMWLFSK